MEINIREHGNTILDPNVYCFSTALKLMKDLGLLKKESEERVNKFIVAGG